MTTEFEFIRWLRDRQPAALIPGDDCAVLPTLSAPLVTTDVLMDGVDFILIDVGPRAVGRKAMAVNLSDIAAMGGRAKYAVLGLVLPQGNDAGSIAREIYLGAEEVAHEFVASIVGGDTNAWLGKLVVSVTVIGEAGVHGPLLRSGAKPGDSIFVTGPCGGSIRGRHLNPRPRLNEIEALQNIAAISACIDISDGLSADLNHILEASGCGAIVDADAIPIHTDAMELAKTSDKSPLEHALGDGEDFELIFTASAGEAEKLHGHPHAIRIGECTESGFQIRDANGLRTLAPTGWVHGFAHET